MIAMFNELVCNAGDIDVVFIGDHAQNSGIMIMGKIFADQIILLFILKFFQNIIRIVRDNAFQSAGAVFFADENTFRPA